ncbi:hypothetical protein ACB092_03G097500 [Castanea dentata]
MPKLLARIRREREQSCSSDPREREKYPRPAIVRSLAKLRPSGQQEQRETIRPYINHPNRRNRHRHRREWIYCFVTKTHKLRYSLLRDSQYNKGLTNALVIQLIPCCQSVVAVMLAKKTGFQSVFPIIGFEPITYCLLFKRGWSATKEKVLSLFEVMQQLAR